MPVFAAQRLAPLSGRGPRSARQAWLPLGGDWRFATPARRYHAPPRTRAQRQQFDVTLNRYLQTGLTVILNVALVLAMVGFFGVETTTFAP